MLHRCSLGKTAQVIALGSALAWSVNATPAKAQDQAAYAHLLSAVYEMREAKTELREEKKHDFGGWRDKAVRDLDIAIEQTEKALRAVKVELKYRAPEGKVYGSYKNYPHLRHAVVELREAMRELKEEKRHDFGGERDRAIREIDIAIDRLEAAINAVK